MFESCCWFQSCSVKSLGILQVLDRRSFKILCTLFPLLLKSLLLTLLGSTPRALKKIPPLFQQTQVVLKMRRKCPLHGCALVDLHHTLALQPMSGWHIARLQHWFAADRDLARHTVPTSAASPCWDMLWGWMWVKKLRPSQPCRRYLLSKVPREWANLIGDVEEVHKNLKSFSKGRYRNWPITSARWYM